MLVLVIAVNYGFQLDRHTHTYTHTHDNPQRSKLPELLLLLWFCANIGRDFLVTVIQNEQQETKVNGLLHSVKHDMKTGWPLFICVKKNK